MADLEQELRGINSQIGFLKNQLEKNIKGETTYSQGTSQPDSPAGLMAGIEDWAAEKTLVLKQFTKEVISRQFDAMHTETVQVGLLRTGHNVSGEIEKRMTLREWDKKSLLESIGWLRYNNIPHVDPKEPSGILPAANINIRPVGDHRMTMIDDVNAQSIRSMNEKGFAPSVVIETSPNNFQVWLDHGQEQTATGRTAAARQLATMFDGDIGAAQGNHMGRLAGFTNRKDKYETDGKFPWVILHQATGKPYEKAKEFLDGVAQQLEQDKMMEREREARFVTMRTFRTETEVRMKTIDDFRNQAEYAGDGHRSDIAYAKYALTRGVSEGQVAAEIRSRDLSKKGGPRQQEDYIRRTIEKAARDRGMER